MPRTRPTFWQRLRRLFWRGEALDDPGYPVHPFDLLDGPKGIEHSFYGLLAAWRRRCGPGQAAPGSTALDRARAREAARLLELTNPFAQSILSALRSYVL